MIGLRAALLYLGLCISFQSTLLATFVRLQGLDPISFGALAPGEGDQRQNDNFCVRSRGGFHHYRVMAWGHGHAGAFIISGQGRSLPLELRWNGHRGVQGNKLLRPFRTRSFSNRGNRYCRQYSNANIELVMRASDIAAAKPGHYTGTIHLLVSVI